MFSQIVFWCIVLYIPACWLKKRIEISSKEFAMFLCHITGVRYQNLFKEIEDLEKRPFYKLWGK